MRDERGISGPHRDGLRVASGRGAQVPAVVQVARLPGTGPQGEPEGFPQVRRGVPGTARPQVQQRHPVQQVRQVPQVARIPGRGQRGRADRLGGGEVAGLDQHLGHRHAALPGDRGRNLAGELLGLPGQPHRLVYVVDGRGGEGEVQQGASSPSG